MQSLCLSFSARPGAPAPSAVCDARGHSSGEREGDAGDSWQAEVTMIVVAKSGADAMNVGKPELLLRRAPGEGLQKYVTNCVLRNGTIAE